MLVSSYNEQFYKCTLMLVHRKEKLLVRSLSVKSNLIIFCKANRVDPDQAALTRTACSLSAMFAKVSKGVSMR